MKVAIHNGLNICRNEKALLLIVMNTLISCTDIQLKEYGTIKN